MLAPDIEVLRQIEDARYGRDGTIERYIRVEFMVGKHGPFLLKFNREGFTGVTRDLGIEAFAREVRTS